MAVMRHRPDIDAVLHGDPHSDEWRGFNAGVRAAWRAWEAAEPADLQGAVKALEQLREGIEQAQRDVSAGGNPLKALSDIDHAAREGQ